MVRYTPAFAPAPGLTAIASTLPLKVLIPAANCAGLLLACFVLFGIATRFCSIALTGCLLLLNSMVFSTGKIDHDLLLVLMPCLLSGIWGSARGNTRASKELKPRWQLGVLAALLGMTMMSAGLPKIVSGWLDSDTQSVLGYCLTYAGDDGRMQFFLNQALAITPLAVWEIQDWAAVALEVSLLPACLFPWLFRRLLFVAAAFHVGVWLQMDLAFPYQFPVYAAFVPWTRVFGVCPLGERWTRKDVVFAVTVAVAGSWMMLARERSLISFGDLTAARNAIILAALITLFVAYRTALRTQRSGTRPRFGERGGERA